MKISRTQFCRDRVGGTAQEKPVETLATAEKSNFILRANMPMSRDKGETIRKYFRNGPLI